MFVGNYSYDNTIFQIPKKRLTGCSLVISLPIDTKTSYMHARPSSIQRGKGCDVFIRVRESLTAGTQDFEFSISTLALKRYQSQAICSTTWLEALRV